ncbi:hypothetical protein LWI29_006082 [Acer saccharum]|uniref:Uncharacterized protein n=1 Tax=Acer saccharum TaxID=4024 RepID=A0AA39RP00_ACESA|nr:hypothetical protein LWI29_006082 [Acer saccharum]
MLNYWKLEPSNYARNSILTEIVSATVSGLPSSRKLPDNEESIVLISYGSYVKLGPPHCRTMRSTLEHYPIMIGRRGGRGSHQPQNRHEPPNRERDLRDIEMYDLRRQVQQL